MPTNIANQPSESLETMNELLTVIIGLHGNEVSGHLMEQPTASTVAWVEANELSVVAEASPHARTIKRSLQARQMRVQIDHTIGQKHLAKDFDKQLKSPL